MALIKTKEDKKELVELISDTVREAIVPALEAMETRIKNELGGKIDSLDRKFDAQQERQDKHNERIEKLEEIHPTGKHKFATG